MNLVKRTICLVIALSALVGTAGATTGLLQITDFMLGGVSARVTAYDQNMGWRAGWFNVGAFDCWVGHGHIRAHSRGLRVGRRLGASCQGYDAESEDDRQ